MSIRSSEIIEEWESKHPAKLDDLQKELRNKILFVHELVEDALNILIIRSTYSDVIGEVKGDMQSVLESNLSLVLDTADFFRKVKYAIDYELIKEKGAFEKLRYFNDLRNWFSHPKAYRWQLETFKDFGNFNKTLDKVVEVKLLMDRAVAAFKTGTNRIGDLKIKKGLGRGLFIDFLNIKQTREIFLQGSRNKFKVIEVNYDLPKI